jgi:long-chain acyl-CoA synthetase
MTAMMLAPLQLGSTVIYMSRFSPVGAVEHIRKHGVSLMFGVPSMFGAMLRLKSATADDFKNVYALISGGEPLPSNIRDGFRQRFNVNLLEGFGLTETSPVVALNVPQDNRPGSVGKPLPGVLVKIVDDNGTPLPQGQQGELWLKGPMIMKGYHHLPEATADALTADGYFKTGDLGHVDPDGFLYITGRKKDIIIVAGEKAVPREIEETILKLDTVADAAVVGKKDPGRGEVVVAFVTAKDGQSVTADQIKETCRQHGLPQWKIPREVIIVPDLPRSPTGKILKRVLAEQVNSPA